MSLRNSWLAAAAMSAVLAPGFARADYYPTCRVLQNECEKQAAFYSDAHPPGESAPFSTSDCSIARANADRSGVFNSPMPAQPPMMCQQ